ncbi:MAG TPA: NAD(P)/FAD-dependent oxidoreductase [Gemmatimonadaceae bacterium]|nr:NAD(P)/FAD-dependent oxidoreductase [Gemmatimonadaceae bacterium]
MNRRPRVVIIGGGFGGLYAARALRTAPVDVTLVDRTNHHLFQPLLYQVATAVLSPNDIASPIRFLLRRQKNTTVLLAYVDRIDLNRQVVSLDGGADELEYDYLLIATGARHSYFGHPEWEQSAPGLKSLVDSLEIRKRFLLAFEEAEKVDDDRTKNALLTFVVIGGGPTGVELAGILPDVAYRSLEHDFRRIDTRRARVLLLEGGSRVLPAFPEELSEHARRDLESLGVEVRTNALVTRVEPDAVYVGDDERIETRTVFWAAGNEASPLARDLGVPLDRQGRVPVERDLSVPGHPEVFVVGDLAAFKQRDGTLVPGVAPAAMQQGRTAARNIVRSVHDEPRREFRYLNKGNLATIGRHRAVADFGWLRLTGSLAWWMWLFVHIMYLAGFRNRLSVLLEWGYAYFTYRRGARLITEADERIGTRTAEIRAVQQRQTREKVAAGR